MARTPASIFPLSYSPLSDLRAQAHAPTRVSVTFVTFRRPPPPAGGGTREKLSFPETYCRDPALFDKAIDAMRAGSLASRTRQQVEADITRRTEQHYKRDITAEQRLAIGDLGLTYETFHKLRLEGRDTIWSYVARNLSRPLALSSGGGWANVLVGNPPWVAYRHMSADLQKRFNPAYSPGCVNGRSLPFWEGSSAA